MKKLLIILAILFISCSKETCECYYSEALKQYVPGEKWEKAIIENSMTYERRRALDLECKANKGCE